jgi:hypothetical protein
MPAGLALPQDIHSGIPNRNLLIMLGIIKTQIVRRIRSVRRSPIPGSCRTCMAMSGNGCRMEGIATTTVHLLTAVRGKVEMAPPESLAAGAAA